MTREIKFRAYDNGKKEWLCGYEIPNLGGFSLLGETVMLGEWSRVIDEFIFERNGHKQDDLKVMQFTGLKNKNGKEIYEDDILKVVALNCKVAWNQYKAKYYLEEVGGTFKEPLNQSKAFIYEIIGNIYENVELLK